MDVSMVCTEAHVHTHTSMHNIHTRKKRTRKEFFLLIGKSEVHNLPRNVVPQPPTGCPLLSSEQFPETSICAVLGKRKITGFQNNLFQKASCLSQKLSPLKKIFTDILVN